MLTHEARLAYYYSFVFPCISYNIVMRGPTNRNHLNPLIVQHKRIIRIITNSGFLKATTPLFAKLKILKIVHLYKFNLIRLTRKRILDDSFRNTHELNTRNSDLAVPELTVN